MVFTPLLASTTVGTLDPRCVTVSLTQINKALYRPQNQLYIAEAKHVDSEKQVVHCLSADNIKFSIAYDKLAICTGSQVNNSLCDIQRGMLLAEKKYPSRLNSLLINYGQLFEFLCTLHQVTKYE